MQVYEALVKVQGDGGYAMSEPVKDEHGSVDEWADSLAGQYGFRIVTDDLSGIVQLPASLLTDRDVVYVALRFDPNEEPVIYAAWED